MAGGSVDASGGEVTFDPASGTVNVAGVKSIDPSQEQLYGVSCSSATQCTAIDYGGGEVTFDPTSGTVNAVGVKPIAAGVMTATLADRSAPPTGAVSPV